MSATVRRNLPLMITFIIGMLVISDYYIKVPSFNKAVSDAMVFVLVVASFAVIIGTATATRIHARNVIRRRTGWYNSVALLAALYGMLILGLVFAEGKFTAHPTYQYWWTNIYVPLDSTIFSLLAFYISSAAYRAFRVRTREATVLLISAVIVMLGRAPIGQAIWPAIGPITSWIMSVPNTAGMRGVTMGVALGTLSMGIRVLIGRERGYLGPGA
ncbi:MAG: hypothetical protein V1857_05250 [archaeon]